MTEPSDWQDIYLRDKDGGTDVMFDGGSWDGPSTSRAPLER